jgi:hypothetical protein
MRLRFTPQDGAKGVQKWFFIIFVLVKLGESLKNMINRFLDDGKNESDSSGVRDVVCRRFL